MATLNSIRSAMTNNQTTIFLSTVCDFPQTGVCQIESELIHYNFASDQSLESCTRGFAGTTAATHAVGKSVTFVSQDVPSETFNESVYYTETNGDSHSHQTVAADLTVLNGGSNDVTNPKYRATSMFNLFGDALTHVANYLGGVIGAYSVTGTKSTHYPAGAVLAQITDGVTDCDGAVVAYIDGDSSQTKANAAFKVMHNNSTSGSGFHWGLDFKSQHDSYNAVAFLDGEIRFSNGTKLTVSGNTIVFTSNDNSKTATITMS